MSTDIKSVIMDRVGALPAEAQERVLAYVTSLTPVPGRKGSSLLSFAGALDQASALEMLEAIESGCESVDPGEW